MNYLLVMPRLVGKIGDPYMFPPGIAYISAAMKAADMNVVNLNLNHVEGTEKEILNRYIKKYSIDMVLTGGLTLEYAAIKRILKAAKEISPTIITVCGGGIITSSPVPAMKALEYVDYGVIGEGEYTVVELCQILEKKGNVDKVEGIIYFSLNIYRETASREEEQNLDLLPIPDYEGFGFFEFLKLKANNAGFFADHTGLIVASRSCPFQCTFCFHPSGRTYRQRSLDSVFEEIDLLIKKYKIKFLSLEDELFSYNIERVKEFCARIKEYGIKWTAQFRVSGVTEEMIKILKDANCVVISYGIESADDSILKSMQKHISVADIENALKITYDNGMAIQGNFIFGDIKETRETAERTLTWWENHRHYNIYLALIRTFPGTKLYKYAVEQKIINDEVQFIKDGCPYVNVSALSASEYQELDQKLTMLMNNNEEPNGIHDIHLNENGVNFIGSCTKCGEKNEWQIADLFGVGEPVRCSLCGKRHRVPVFSEIQNHILNGIESILKNYNKVAFWGMGKYFMWQIYKTPMVFENNSIYFIDTAKTRQGINDDQKKIYGPEILNDINFEVVIVTIPRYFFDIKDQIYTNYMFKGKLINIADLVSGKP